MIRYAAHMARPTKPKENVKAGITPVRMAEDERRYLLEAAARDADGAGLPLSTFLRSGGHVRAKDLLGLTFEQWKAQEQKPKRKEGR